MKIFAGILLFLIASISLFGQVNTMVPYSTPISESFDFGDVAITDVDEDWNGIHWLATTDGLYKLDGTSVEVFTKRLADSIILNDQINDILIDHQYREIWIATPNGLTCFHPGTGRAFHYQNNHKDSSSLADNYVRTLILDQTGQLWMNCINNGLCVYQRETDNFRNSYYDNSDIDTIINQDRKQNESYFNNYLITANDVDTNIIWWAGYHGLTRFNRSAGEFKWEYLNCNDDKFYRLKYAINNMIMVDSTIIFSSLYNIFLYQPYNQKMDSIYLDDAKAKRIGKPMYFHLNDDEISVSYQRG